MIFIQVFFLILLLEIFILLTLLIVLITERIFYFFAAKKILLTERYLRKLLSEYVKKNYPYVLRIPLFYRNDFVLLKELSIIDQEISGKEWNKFKNAIIATYMLKKARRWSQSIFWKRRFFSARTFTLFCEVKDKIPLFHLIEDSSFNVQREACLALLKMEDKKIVLLLLKKLEKASPILRLFIKDALITHSFEMTSMIENALSSTRNKQMIISCLDILASKKTKISSDRIYTMLSTDDEEMKRALIHLHALNPQKGSRQILLDALSHQNPDIRILALKGLSQFPSDRVLKVTCQSLEDKDFFVKIQAAQSLKQFGAKGMEILKDKERCHNVQIRQAVCYVKNLEEKHHE